MTESIEPAPTEGHGGTMTATLAPRDMVWEVPAAAGGDGGGAAPVEGPPWSPAPAPRSRRNVTGLIAAFVVTALIAFLAAGSVRSRATTTSTTTTPPFVAAPARPSAGATPAPAAPSTSSGTSSLSTSDVQAIAAKVNKGVVNINTELGFGDGNAAGTGMVLTSTGEVLTNNHVIEGSTKISVTVVDTGRTYAAHVVGTSPSNDVAVIQLEGASGLKTITASTTTVAVGDPVVASGNAGGRGGAPTAVAGTVIALNQAITATDDNGGNAERLTNLIQVDAAIEPGDSGGPLANRAGEVIGMDSAAEVSRSRRSVATTSGFAIPIAKALAIADQIESGQASSTVHIGLPAFLGVQIAGTAAQRGVLPTSAGALVAGVERGTPAATIGLAAGDTITSVGGEAVDTPSRLTTLLQAARPGDRVAVGWTDQAGTPHTATATLMAGPAD